MHESSASSGGILHGTLVSQSAAAACDGPLSSQRLTPDRLTGTLALLREPETTGGAAIMRHQVWHLRSVDDVWYLGLLEYGGLLHQAWADRYHDHIDTWTVNSLRPPFHSTALTNRSDPVLLLLLLRHHSLRPIRLLMN